MRACRRCWATVLLVLFAFARTGILAAQVPPDGPLQTVEREAIREAMAAAAEGGYSLTASTNSTRFTTFVIFSLVRQAMAESLDEFPLLLDHSDWYEAYRQVTGLAPEDVPEFVALLNEYGQDVIIDYRPSRTAVQVKEGPEPELVLNVTASWPKEPGGQDKYSLVDTTTSPRMKVTNKRFIRYRLLDFGDMVVLDEIKGVSGRPLGGALGTLFSIIGEGDAKQTRFAISDDGLMVTYSTAKKSLFSVHPLTLTSPDGTVEMDFPEERIDLREIADRLKQPLKIEYETPNEIALP